jgi:ATP-dependent Clp protease ATP-binding subunit ClpA
VVEFSALDREILLRVVKKFVNELEQQLSEKKVELQIEEGVYEWLFEKGHDPAYGARPFARTVSEHLKKPLVDDLLFGDLSSGGVVKISVKGKLLAFAIQ